MLHVAHVYARVLNATAENSRGDGWRWRRPDDNENFWPSGLPPLYTIVLQCIPKRHHNLAHIAHDFIPPPGLCAPRESEWVVGRRTVDDLRSRAADPNNFSKLFRRPYDYNAGNSSLGPRTLTHSCLFLRVYTIVNHLQLSSGRFTGLRYYILLYLLGHRPALDKRLRDSVFLSLLVYTYIYIYIYYSPSPWQTYPYKNLW